MAQLPPEAVQFAASLAAILLLAWAARRLGLGPAPRLADEAEARAACESAAPGFEPVALARDIEGHGAIARDADGRILVLRPHGSHFAARVLPAGAHAHRDGAVLVVDSAEARFGQARLTLADPAPWVTAIASGSARGHA